jgi:hypothetical protein
MICGSPDPMCPLLVDADMNRASECGLVLRRHTKLQFGNTVGKINQRTLVREHIIRDMPLQA